MRRLQLEFMGSCNESGPDDQISGNRLMGLVGIYNGSAFRVAARFTAFALTGFRAKPFFHELSSDQDFVGLQHILFEAIGIDAFFGQADDNAGLTERVVELLYGLFNFLLRSPASGTVFCCSSSSRCHFMTSVFISVFPTTG